MPYVNGEYEMEEGDLVYLCETPHGTRYVRVTNDKRDVNAEDRGYAVAPTDGDWRSIEAAWLAGATEEECAIVASDDRALDFIRADAEVDAA